MSDERRSNAQTAALHDRVMLEETARLDEVEIIEFAKVAKQFPEYFKGPW
jgi:transcriptional regulator NrdR family protein